MQTEASSPSKRAFPFDDHDPPFKRQRAQASTVEISLEGGGATIGVEEQLNDFHVNRKALQRSIALALKHVGFDGASEEAMESFTQLAETC